MITNEGGINEGGDYDSEGGMEILMKGLGVSKWLCQGEGLTGACACGSLQLRVPPVAPQQFSSRHSSLTCRQLGPT